MTAPQSVVTEQPGRRRWTARVLAVLAILGPGLIGANAGIDAGGI
jgi:Mn2+/Fe2+ NRAMP family transporter